MKIDGHRRIANSLFLRYRPIDRPYTDIEALVQMNLDESVPGGCLRPIAEYARMFGHSRNWCRSRIGQYRDTQDALKSKRKQPPKDTLGASQGHAVDSGGTPLQIQNQSEDPEEEKKDPAADAAPGFVLDGNGAKPPRKRKAKKVASSFPDPFPIDMRSSLNRWGMDNGFSPPQVDYAIDFVRDWAGSHDKVMKDWQAAIRNGMRAGWALPKPGGGNETPDQRRARVVRELEQEGVR